MTVTTNSVRCLGLFQCLSCIWRQTYDQWRQICDCCWYQCLLFISYNLRQWQLNVCLFGLMSIVILCNLWLNDDINNVTVWIDVHIVILSQDFTTSCTINVCLFGLMSIVSFYATYRLVTDKRVTVNGLMSIVIFMQLTTVDDKCVSVKLDWPVYLVHNKYNLKSNQWIDKRLTVLDWCTIVIFIP